jgi:hypothetical protein
MVLTALERTSVWGVLQLQATKEWPRCTCGRAYARKSEKYGTQFLGACARAGRH